MMRSEPHYESLTHEAIGDYSYFVEPKNDKYAKYDVCKRFHNKDLQKYQDESQRSSVTEVVLDIAEVPFIREKWSKSTIQKIRASDDHTRIAFTVETDETEK